MPSFPPRLTRGSAYYGLLLMKMRNWRRLMPTRNGSGVTLLLFAVEIRHSVNRMF